MKVQAVENTMAELGECPVWDPRLNRLYWVDVLQGKLSCSDLSGHTRLLARLEGSIGAVALTDDVNQLVLATEKGFCLFDLTRSSTQSIHDPEKHLPDNRFNDGKCDPSGRFWAGSMAKDGQGASGHLYRLDADGQVERKLSDVNCSNGLAWSAAQDKMYYIDTGRRCLDTFDYDPEKGDLENRQTLLAIPEEEGLPDGMTIDAEGKLWVALWGGSSVIRVDPAQGSMVDRIPLPVAQVTSCTFGGEDLGTLFITTANLGLSETDKSKQPLAGHLFACDVGVKGSAAHFYKRKADHAFN